MENPNYATKVVMGSKTELLGIAITYAESDMSLDEFQQSDITSYKQNNVSVSDVKKITLDGVPCYKMTIKMMDDITIYSYTLKKNGVLYNLKIGNNETLLIKNKSMVNRIANSFKIINSSDSPTSTATNNTTTNGFQGTAMPAVVQEGENFRVTYIVNANSSDMHMTDNEAFAILMGPSTSTSMSTQITNGQITTARSTTYTYVLKAQKVGSFTIAPASVTVGGQKMQSNAITVKVVEKGQSTNQNGGGTQQQDNANQNMPQQQQNCEIANSYGSDYYSNNSDDYYDTQIRRRESEHNMRMFFILVVPILLVIIIAIVAVNKKQWDNLRK